LQADISIVDDGRVAPELSQLVAQLVRERGVALEDENLVGHESFPKSRGFSEDSGRFQAVSNRLTRGATPSPHDRFFRPWRRARGARLARRFRADGGRPSGGR